MTDLAYLRPPTPTWGPAKFGVSSLTGTFALADGIQPFLNADSSQPGTGTFEAWVRRAPSVTDLQVFMSNQNFWVAINGSGNLQCDKVGTTTDVAIGDGGWHHVALVFDAGSAALYCDGAKVSGDAIQGAYASASNLFNIGGLSEANTSFDFDGDIDEVRLSTVARYSGPSYAVPTAAFTGDGSTAELWHLDDGTPPDPEPDPEPDPDHRYRLGFEPLVWDGTAYPPRHPGAASVLYIGPLEPAGWLSNDLWVRKP